LTRSGSGLLLRALGCLAVTLFLLQTHLFPLGGVPAAGPGSDHGLLTWNFWWLTESVLHARNPYQTSLLFHPLGSSLAAHTLAPGLAPIGLVAKAAVAGDPLYPLYALRLSMGVCFFLGMLLACEAFRALGATGLPAFAAATGWAFAAVWRPFVGNPTLASACFIVPAVTLGIASLVEAPSVRRAAILGVLVGAPVYFSEYFGGFLPLVLLVAALCALLGASTRPGLVATARALGARGVVMAAVGCVLVVLPFAVEWARTEGRPPAERQIEAGGANLAGFVIPYPGMTPFYRSPAIARLYARVSRGRGPFLGAPTLLLAALGAFTRGRRLRVVLLGTALVFVVLSLGPTLKAFGSRTTVSLPYALLQHMPPFQMARDPQRLAVFAVWPLAILAAVGLTGLVESIASRARPGLGTVVGVAALVWWIAEGYWPQPRPVPYAPPPALADLPAGAVANVPLTIRDGYAMFLQVFHGRPIVTGYVSRPSPEQYARVEGLQKLLDADPAVFAAELQALGVGTVVLEPGAPDGLGETIAGYGLTVVDLRGTTRAP
jgi:hypothetical protein